MSYSAVLFLLVLAAMLIITAVWRYYSGHFFKAAKKEEKSSITNASYYLAEGRYDEALKEFKSVILGGYGAPEIYVIVSVLHRLHGDMDKAAYFSEEALLWQDKKEDIVNIALAELAKNCLITGKTYNAKNCLLKLPKKFQHLLAANLINAEICKEKGDFEAAERFYSKYEAQSGKKCGGIIAEMYIRHMKNIKDSTYKIKTLRNIVKTYPKNGTARFALANALFDDGKDERGLNEIKAVIANDLIKTKAELLEIENIFYKYSTLDELFHIMSSKIASESENPVPYLFVSSYYSKINDTARAQDVLKAYLLQFQPKIIITKAYTKLINDGVLPRLMRFDSIYYCGVCKTEFSDYTAVCSKCGSIDSLDYR